MPKKRSSKAGLPPGTPIHIGDTTPTATKITVIDYTPTSIEQKTARTVKECLSFKNTKSMTWINVDGLADLKLLEELCEGFELHPLVIEDILNTEQRPKVEDHEKYLYIVLRMLESGAKNGIMTEQISIVVGSNFLLSFQETPGDIFDPIRERIRNKKGNIRKSGPDFLAYSLIDAIVDHYFLILENFGERIENLEKELITNPSPNTLRQLYRMKREMIKLRKSVWPLRELINNLERAGFSPLVKKNTRLYLRDVYDHSIQAIDSTETYREMLSGMLDIYLSSVSNRLNEVMKILTVIATIFIPLTFVTGLYGMNFRFMPELEHPWGYPAALLLMLVMSLLMLAYFRRKRWV